MGRPDVEIIDLTGSPEPIVVASDDDAARLASPTKTSRRKRKHPDSTSGSGHATKAANTRENSRERTYSDDLNGQSNRGTRVTNGKSCHDPSDSLSCASSPLPHRPDVDIFFVDLKPADVSAQGSAPDDIAPGSSKGQHTSLVAGANADKGSFSLLLPAHVAVSGVEDVVPLEDFQPAGSDTDDYIEYLDYDDHKSAGLVRYFHEVQEEAKHTRSVCKKCGGDHKTYDCAVKICLTCGARDEHSTRSCPISKTCFRCGMKGHISSNCTNAKTHNQHDLHSACDRCGSDIHRANECPTLWRVYEYVAQEERDKMLSTRRAKSTLTIGTGGEGYIAEDEWCYNCGQCGHWGDDCHQPRVADRLAEPSAFSAYNMRSGPFFDPSEKPSSPKARRRSDWENEDSLPDGWGKDAPINVGKRGRNKAKERLEKQARALNEGMDESEDDWFANPRGSRSRDGPAVSGENHRAKKAVALSFKDRLSEPSASAPRYQNQNRAHRSLFERLGPCEVGEYRPKSRSQPSGLQPNRGHGSYRHQDSRHNGRRNDQPYSDWRDRDRVDSRRKETGPRYRGGYGR